MNGTDLSPSVAALSAEVPDPTAPTTEEKLRGLAMATCDVLWPYPDLARDLSRVLADHGLHGLADSFWLMSENARARQPITTKEPM